MLHDTRMPDRRKKPYITVLKKWKKIPEESDLDSSSESICSFDSEICLAGKKGEFELEFHPIVDY